MPFPTQRLRPCLAKVAVPVIRADSRCSDSATSVRQTLLNPFSQKTIESRPSLKRWLSLMTFSTSPLMPIAYRDPSQRAPYRGPLSTSLNPELPARTEMKEVFGSGTIYSEMLQLFIGGIVHVVYESGCQTCLPQPLISVTGAQR
jgi:hypothetical protein